MFTLNQETGRKVYGLRARSAAVLLPAAVSEAREAGRKAALPCHKAHNGVVVQKTNNKTH